MAKKGKFNPPFHFVGPIGLFRAIHFALQRLGLFLSKKFQPSKPVHDHDDYDEDEHEEVQTSQRRDIPSRVRFIFIVVAFPVVIMSLLLMMFALMVEGDENIGHRGPPQTTKEKIKLVVHEYNSFFLFVSASSAAINAIAICAAIFNWSTILFAYVVITGLCGTMVGVVGICGIIITCVLMSHKSASDHSIAITALMVLAFVLIFYVLTIIGLKVMNHVRRRSAQTPDVERRQTRQFRSSPPVSRRTKRSSYKSIDSITSPLNGGDEQELSQVYVDKSSTPSSIIPSPTTPSSVKLNQAASLYRPSTMLQV